MKNKQMGIIDMNQIVPNNNIKYRIKNLYKVYTDA